MWKIEKISDRGRTLLTLSGRLESDHLGELQTFLAAEADDHAVVLDLSGVKLVDQDVVSFLADCEKGGTELRNCPGYIREWINSRLASS